MRKTSPRGRSRALVLAALTAATALLVGCTSAPSVDPSASGKYNDYPSILSDKYAGANLTFWGWDKQSFDKPIEDYVKAVAGIGTKGRQVAGNDMVTQLQLAATQGSGLPDVFKSGTANIPQLVKIGAAADMTKLVAPYKKYLPDIGWKQVTYKGKIWGIPVNSPAGGMFYRADVLKKYGIDPASLDTWDKYFDAAKKLATDSGGKNHLWSYQQSLSIGVQMIAIQENHAAFFNADGSLAISPDSPEWNNAMDLIRQMLQPGISKEVPEWGQDWFQAIKDGSVASFPQGTWFLQTIIQQAPDSKGDWAFMPYPAPASTGDRYVDFGSSTIHISTQSKDPKAALQLALAWSIDPEGAVGIGLEKLGISVVASSVADSKFATSPSPYFANDQAYWVDADKAYQGITWSPPINSDNAQALAIFGTALADFIKKKDSMSNSQFLKTVISQMKSQIKSLQG